MSKLARAAITVLVGATGRLKAFLLGFSGLEPRIPACSDALEDLIERRARRGPCC